MNVRQLRDHGDSWTDCDISQWKLTAASSGVSSGADSNRCVQPTSSKCRCRSPSSPVGNPWLAWLAVHGLQSNEIPRACLAFAVCECHFGKIELNFRLRPWPTLGRITYSNTTDISSVNLPVKLLVSEQYCSDATVTTVTTVTSTVTTVTSTVTTVTCYYGYYCND